MSKWSILSSKRNWAKARIKGAKSIYGLTLVRES
jgi:hypothetical protein